MKRVLLLFLCLILAASLCACGASPSVKPQGKDDEPVGETAVIIDGTAYSVAEVDYYYHAILNSLLQDQYAAYLGITANMDFHDVMSGAARSYLGVSDESTTWDAYLKDEAVNNLKYVDALSKLAQKEGYTFTDEMQKNLDTQMENLRTAAESVGVSEAEYLETIFGSNVTEAVFIKTWKQAAIANAFRIDHQNGMNFTESELEAYYTENRDGLDTVSFEVIYFDGNPETKRDSDGNIVPATDEEKAAAREAAHSAAHEALERYNAGEVLERIARDYEIASYNKQEAGTNSSSDVMRWLFDAGRQTGDVTVLETEPSCYLLLFHSRSRSTARTVDVRHILFLTDTSSLDKNAGTYEADVQAIRDAARKKADDTLTRWKTGEATEDSFASLANELSEDPGSNTNGGLYEKVYEGQMVQPFNDWCFDESRRTGDTDVVETDYGFHVMYFAGENQPYWKMVADNVLRSQKQQEWLLGLVENVTVTREAGMDKVG